MDKIMYLTVSFVFMICVIVFLLSEINILKQKIKIKDDIIDVYKNK